MFIRQILQQIIQRIPQESIGVLDAVAAERERLEFLLVRRNAVQSVLAQLRLRKRTDGFDDVMHVVALRIVEEDGNGTHVHRRLDLHVAAGVRRPAVLPRGVAMVLYFIVRQVLKRHVVADLG